MFGHYTCDSDGKKVCLAGWRGDQCDIRKLLSFLYLKNTVQTHEKKDNTREDVVSEYFWSIL